ncbi:hypothetical protein [Streptomyces sp. NPDC019890]|uniref:hypothetical protein n=1 Tax=Streptomyces sp. NPDC019890 TaxID=3365064 RepID=UPI003850387C
MSRSGDDADELRGYWDKLSARGNVSVPLEKLFIGPEAERRFGYRHFMDLTAVFTAAPECTMLSGRTERPQVLRRTAGQ